MSFECVFFTSAVCQLFVIVADYCWHITLFGFLVAFFTLISLARSRFFEQEILHVAKQEQKSLFLLATDSAIPSKNEREKKNTFLFMGSVVHIIWPYHFEYIHGISLFFVLYWTLSTVSRVYWIMCNEFSCIPVFFHSLSYSLFQFYFWGDIDVFTIRINK